MSIDYTKYVPPHVNIFYCLGGITFTCFLVQVATGFAMTFYYRPTVAEAFASVNYLMTDVNFGWLIRSIHRWSASMMVLAMILHVFRVCDPTKKSFYLSRTSHFTMVKIYRESHPEIHLTNPTENKNQKSKQNKQQVSAKA